MLRPHSALVLHLFLSSLLFVISLEVVRFEQDLIYTGSRNCSLCSNYKANCTTKGEACRCIKSRSTFTIYNRTCMDTVVLVNDNNCLRQRDGPLDEILPTVDLATFSSRVAQYKLPVDAVNCSPVSHGFFYLGRSGTWRLHKLGSSQQRFKTTNDDSTGNIMTFQIINNTDLRGFAGRILRVDLICNESGNGKKQSCVLLKAKGNISDTNPSQPVSTGSPVSIPVKETKSTRDNLPSSLKSSKTALPRNPVLKTTDDPTTILYAYGVVSIDDEDEDDEVVVTTIVTIGVIVCVLIICVSAWFIARYHQRSRRQDDTSVSRYQVVENGGACAGQGVIPMSSVPGTDWSEPVYSELPDVIESARCRRFFPSNSSIVRNPAIYNTMPKARKNTDPLPVIPLQVTTSTPEPRGSFLINACTDNTRTAKFLDEMNRRGCMSLNRKGQCGRRERSSTDVDLLDDVFSGDIWTKPGDDDGDDVERDRSESFYQHLHSNPGSKTSLYESLHEATKESPKARFSTIERIKQQSHFENYGLSLLDESDRVHNILQSSNQNAESKSSGGEDGERPDLPEYYTLEGPEELQDSQEKETVSVKLLSLKRPSSEGDIMKVFRKKQLRSAYSSGDFKKARFVRSSQPLGSSPERECRKQHLQRSFSERNIKLYKRDL